MEERKSIFDLRASFCCEAMCILVVSTIQSLCTNVDGQIFNEV